ncbi:MAG TPA: hypothetical protein VHQ46_06455 [Desulfobacteria bacterium]|nr:hypothetical protein [Desulfobacteria bacterium]
MRSKRVKLLIFVLLLAAICSLALLFSLYRSHLPDPKPSAATMVKR